MIRRFVRRGLTFVGVAIATATGLCWWLYHGDLLAAAADGREVVSRE